MRLLTAAQISHDACSDRVRTYPERENTLSGSKRRHSKSTLLAKSLVNTQGFTLPSGMHPAITIRPGCSLPAGTDLVSAILLARFFQD